MAFALRFSIDSLKPYIRYLPRSFQLLVRPPLDNVHLWTGIAWIETVQSYRRTLLGPLWITINLAIFTVAMTLIYGALFSMPTREYAAFVACGMIAWSWNNALLSDLGNTFINYSAFVRNSPINKAIFIWTAVYKQVINLCHHMIVYFVLVAVGVVKLSVYTLLFFPAVVVMFLISIPITAFMAIIFTRYRDLQRLVASTMIVFFMITPIFWQTHMISGWRTALYLFNPFYYLVEFLRMPLMGLPPDPLIVGVVLGLLVFFWIAGAAFYKRYERYVVFWL
jgi:ABC-type polysaccharide/polyol phosphate export permease